MVQGGALVQGRVVVQGQGCGAGAGLLEKGLTVTAGSSVSRITGLVGFRSVARIPLAHLLVLP